MEELEVIKQNITRYDNGAKLVKKKLSKLKGLRKKTLNAVKLNEGKIKLRKLDIDLALKKLNEVRSQINEFENQLKDNEKNFQKDMYNLDDLKLNIQQQTSEVIARTKIMTEACEQLKMSHQLSNDVCSSTRLAAYGAFRRWLLLQPLLKLWLSSDGQVLDTIHATAHYEGIYEEICAHLEAKDALELFADDNYWEYTEEISGNQPSANCTINSLKQANLARFTRSQNFDSMHREMVVKLQHIVSSCENLKEEINQRGILRQKMNSYMMDLSFSLEEDLQSYLSLCEKEATKPATAAMNDMQQKILKPIQKAFNHPKVYLEKNTASNAVSILPTLIKSFHNKSSKANIPEVAVSIPSENDISESIANDILQAYNENAIAYVKSFQSIKQSNTWKWCNSIVVEEQHKSNELEDLHGAILRLFPVVHGPVELLIDSSQQVMKGINDTMQPLVPSTAPPAIRTPSRGLLKGSIKSPVDIESNSIQLEEEEDKMKIQDLGNHSNELGYAGSYNSYSNITLSERKTHLDLKPIDLDKMLHTKPHSAESYPKYRDIDLKDSLVTPLPNETLTPDVHHQYLKHTLSKDSSEQIKSKDIIQKNEVDYDNLCMLYVSILDLSAHSAITTKQIVRHLQSTSANIALETISQISSVLSKATEEGTKLANKKPRSTSEYSDHNSAIEAINRIHDNKPIVSFEVDTTEALENILVDDQVHALHQKVNNRFYNTKKEIESWISDNHNKSYVTFKRALVELLSTNQTNFSVNEKSDELDAGNTRVQNAILDIFEGVDSSLLIEESLKQTNHKPYGIDISKQIISSIQSNIQEFVSNNEEAFGALDYTSANFLDIENNLNKDEINFNPRNYAFRSPTFDPFNQTVAVKSSGTRIDKAAIRSASIDNISNLLATTSIASNHSVAITIPQERTIIHKMESVIRGKMFAIELIWEPISMQTELVMKNYLNKYQFKEYQFVLSQSLLSELISTSIDLILQILFGESIKIMQAIIGCLHVERIDENFYEPVTQRLASHLSSLKIKSDAKIPIINSNLKLNSPSKTNSFLQQRSTTQEVGLSLRNTAFVLKEIDDMLKPIDKVRRGSISSLYRIQLLNEAQAALEKALSRDYLNHNNNNREKEINFNADRYTSDDSIDKKNEKEFCYLLEIVTLRKRKQVLLAYSFPLLCDLEYPGE